MDAGLDSGPILARRRVPIAPDETAETLERRLAVVAADLLDEALGPWLEGRLAPQPQVGEPTLTRPLRRDDGRLDPSRPAVELERRVRAFQPWPGTYLETATGRLLVRAATVEPSVPGDEPGRLVGAGDGLALATAEGRLRLLLVQPAGGRLMTGAEYRRGRPGVVGARVVGGTAGVAEGRLATTGEPAEADDARPRGRGRREDGARGEARDSADGDRRPDDRDAADLRNGADGASVR